MSELREIGDIQLNEDMRFLRREWRAQRVGWIAMLVFLVLGLAGVLGRGPVSKAERGDRASFGVSYERIIRHAAETEVSFHFGAGLQKDSVLKLYISGDYLHDFTISDIVPEPAASGSSGSFVYYTFTRPNARQPGRVVFHMRPNGFWGKTATSALQGATAIRFNQFVLP